MKAGRRSRNGRESLPVRGRFRIITRWRPHSSSGPDLRPCAGRPGRWTPIRGRTYHERRRTMTTFQVAAIGLALVLARPQDDHSSHRVPTIPAELLERPVTIRTGIGTVHDGVTTSSMDAQKFYDQGLAYLHHYNWIEASRSFNQTLRLDPKLALAYIGLSYAYAGVNQPGAARSALERALALGPASSEHER